MTAMLVEARGLTRILPGDLPATLVDGADFTINRGEFTAIIGPSGCGKSSLLYLLGLIDRPTAGSILFDGEDLSGLDGEARAQMRLERLGFVFQFHFLLPEFTAIENVMLPMRRRGVDNAARIRERALELLAAMGLDQKADRTPDRLSGGERQRVAIARALANSPELILGDEPTGNLDSSNSAAVVEIFRDLAHAQGRAVVCVTHDTEIAARADVRIMMRDGKVVQIERGLSVAVDPTDKG